MAKVITKSGQQEQYFLGASEPQIRGAKDVMDAVESACRNTVGEAAAAHLFKNTSSLATDGAAINTGDKGGFWALFEKKRKEECADRLIPLLKFVQI